MCGQIGLSFIIPYAYERPIQLPHIGPSDEIIIMDRDMPIHEARLRAALKARNKWLVLADSDAIYPLDFTTKVKTLIKSGKYPLGFRVKRLGGFGILGNPEPSIIVRRDFFLHMARYFRPIPIVREDYAPLLAPYLPLVGDITYYHPLGRTERLVVSSGSPIMCGIILTLLSMI